MGLDLLRKRLKEIQANMTSGNTQNNSGHGRPVSSNEPEHNRCKQRTKKCCAENDAHFDAGFDGNHKYNKKYYCPVVGEEQQSNQGRSENGNEWGKSI